ncbi:MAG TPA: erythromycin esterase family protein [Bryobacteraceae bacterium]|nr:erythromycin esterase family protein [Bryobacteraceae bacterium]
MRRAAWLLLPAVLAGQADLSQWQVPAPLRALGYTAEPSHEGCHSAACTVLLPPDNAPPGSFGNFQQTLDAATFRGRKVSLSAWVRVENGGSLAPGDRAQMWLRVLRPDRQTAFYDDMGDRPIVSTEWRRYEIAGEVAADAQSIQIGVLSFGKARVWIEGVQLIRGAAPTSAEIDARREIASIYAQIDAAYGRGDVSEMTRRALPDAQIVMGQRSSPLAAAIAQIAAEMSKGTSIESRSTVTSVAVAAGAAVVSVNNDSLMTAASRSELLSFSRDAWVRTAAGWKLQETMLISSRAVTPRTDAATARAVAEELTRRAAPLNGMEGDTGLDSFGRAVGDARIVALGEATHGTSEFYRLNQRLFEYLVRQKGFTVLAIEANWPESLAVNRYIQTGEGDPRKVLAGMNFWTWYTEEMLDLIEWMRAYNQSPGKHATLTFTSFDMQFGHEAADKAVDYLKEYAPDLAGVARAVYGEAYDIEAHRGALYDARAEGVAAQLASVAHEFDTRHRELTEASGEEKWRDARQAAAVVQEACTLRIAGRGPGYRDEAMAGNAEWIAGEAFPREKIVLWAHNAHVRTQGDPKSMGTFLRERFGRQLYVVGYAFRRGGLRAKGPEGGTAADVKVFDAPPSPEGSGDAVLSGARLPLFFLDLSSVPAAGALGRWLAEPHLFHSVGSSWFPDDPDANLEPGVLSKQYNGLIFVEQGHAARPL